MRICSRCGTGLTEQATQANRELAARWNLLATQLGLRTYSADQL